MNNKEEKKSELINNKGENLKAKESTKDESPINLEQIKFFTENCENKEIKEKEISFVKNGYNPGSVFYDKFSKRIIYFNFAENCILIYNRTKTVLKTKLKVYFNFKILNSCIDKKSTYLLIFANPNINNKFIFVYCIAKETFYSQLKEDYSYLLNMFFIEKNFFCLVFAHQIKFYLCDNLSDEVKHLKTLDYSKILINNFFFVRQYLILLIHRGDNSFDMYSLRKNEIELIKTFNEVFNTRSVMFKSSSKGSFFSNLFSSKAEYLKSQKLNILNNYNNSYGNIYKTSQFFLEYIYSNLYFILLSYEDNAIFMMKIKNINKFPKEEEGNKILKLEYRAHSKCSTIQFLDNLLFVHNFTNDTTTIFDIELQAKTKIVCTAKNILKHFHSESFYKIKIIGGIIEETCKIKNEKGQQELTKKLYSLNVDLENLFKDNVKKNINDDESELDGMLMIARRNKSKIFFLELFNKMLLDKTIKHRTDKIQLILNEFSRQIQKSNSLALDLMSNVSQITDAIISPKTVKLGYKKDNEKFYLDDKYIMLSMKNTLSQIEVIKSFKRVGEQKIKDNIKDDEESIFEYLFYILFFCVQLGKNKIEVIKLYYDTILLLFTQIKEEKKMIKFLTYFTNSKFFPFGTADIAKYLLNNFKNPIIKLEGYKILKNLGLYNDLLSYLLKNETFSFTINFLQKTFEESKEAEIKKIIINYLNNCNNKNEIRGLINDYIEDDDE
jgi:hypothetical protein